MTLKVEWKEWQTISDKKQIKRQISITKKKRLTPAYQKVALL